MKTAIGIIGGGNMGAAIIGGIYQEYAVTLCELDKQTSEALKEKYNITTADLKATIESCEVIILAVKPQSFEQVLKEIQPLIDDTKLIISIAAGITTTYIEKRLGEKVRVVRGMPNLPAQVAQGVTGICEGSGAQADDLIQACRIFNHIGKAVVVKEEQMDVVTALSGSGPAYIYHFIECLQKAATHLGMDDQLSKELMLQTIKGSVHLLESQDEDAATLREKVTSKGGTTQAALEILSKQDIEKIYHEALKAAVKRAKELSQQ